MWSAANTMVRNSFSFTALAGTLTLLPADPTVDCAAVTSARNTNHSTEMAEWRRWRPHVEGEAAPVCVVHRRVVLYIRFRGGGAAKRERGTLRNNMVRHSLSVPARTAKLTSRYTREHRGVGANAYCCKASGMSFSPKYDAVFITHLSRHADGQYDLGAPSARSSSRW